jgi:hypothetical protein
MSDVPRAISSGPGAPAGVVASAPGGAGAGGAAPGATPGAAPGRLAALGNPVARPGRPGDTVAPAAGLAVRASATSVSALAAAAPSPTSAAAASGPPPPPWTRSLNAGRTAILSLLHGLKGRARGRGIPAQDLATWEQDVRSFLWHLDRAFGAPTPKLVRSNSCFDPFFVLYYND